MSASATTNITIGAETLHDLYVTMRRIRAFEDKTADLFQEGVVKGTATATRVRRRSPPASARRCATTTSSLPTTAATATASPRAPASTA